MKILNYLFTLFLSLCCLPILVVGQNTVEISTRETCKPKVGKENCTIKISVNGRTGTCADYDCDCNCDGEIILDKQEMDISEVVQARVGGANPCGEEKALCRLIEKWQLGQLPHDPIIRKNPVRKPRKPVLQLHPSNRSFRNSKLPQNNRKFKRSKAKVKSPVKSDKKKLNRKIVQPN